MIGADLVKLCTENNWFTCGSVIQYNKMLSFANEGGSAREISILIWMFSENVSIEQVEDEV